MTTIKFALAFLVGMLVGCVGALKLSSVASHAWQEGMRSKIAYQFELDGAMAAKEGDWGRTNSAFHASGLVITQPARGWSMDYPFYGWSISGLSDLPSESNEIVRESILAYSAEKSGNQEDADRVFTELSRKYPPRTKAYFSQLAQESLRSFQ